jgi:hypothetical protein
MTYWPISAPSVYAASKQKLPEACIATSDDGVRHPGQLQTHPSASYGAAQDEDPESTESSVDPATEDEDAEQRQRQTEEKRLTATGGIPPEECSSEEDISGEIIGIRVTRSGHMFATITRSTLTIWQTKVAF